MVELSELRFNIAFLSYVFLEGATSLGFQITYVNGVVFIVRKNVKSITGIFLVLGMKKKHCTHPL